MNTIPPSEENIIVKPWLECLPPWLEIFMAKLIKGDDDNNDGPVSN